MGHPLMPKATAVWLVDNTVLTFDQISVFCGLHPLEVQAIADGENGANIIGSNPVQNKELTKAEIEACEADSNRHLKMLVNNLPKPKSRAKGPKYTPVSKRGDKPDAIAFLIKNHPELSDPQIVRLIGTTKNTINNIKGRTHSNMTNITPKDPVTLGLCKQEELNNALEKAYEKKQNSSKKEIKLEAITAIAE